MKIAVENFLWDIYYDWDDRCYRNIQLYIQAFVFLFVSKYRRLIHKIIGYIIGYLVIWLSLKMSMIIQKFNVIEISVVGYDIWWWEFGLQIKDSICFWCSCTDIAAHKTCDIVESAFVSFYFFEWNALNGLESGF